MKKIETSSIAGSAKAPFIKATHDHIKESIQETTGHIIKGLMGPYTTGDLIILYGCKVTVTSGSIPGTGSATVSAGAIYYNGEIYEVEAATPSTTANTLIWDIETSYRAGDPVKWSDNTPRNLHRNDKFSINAGTTGSGIADFDATTIKYLTTQLDQISAGSIVACNLQTVTISGTESITPASAAGTTILTIPAKYRTSYTHNIYIIATASVAGGGGSQTPLFVSLKLNTNTGIITNIFDTPALKDTLTYNVSYSLV